jgi:hypothetical protein
MREPVFNPGGLAVLVIVVGTISICFWYGTVVRAVIDSGLWLIFAPMLVAPFVLGYFVGDARDRADYHKLFSWIARKFGSR